MNNSKCYIHGPNPITYIAYGHIEEWDKKYFSGRLFLAEDKDPYPTEYWATFRKSKLHSRYQLKWNKRSEMIGRYYYVKRGSKVHLCDCRWTEEDLAEVRRVANEIFEKIGEGRQLD